MKRTPFVFKIVPCICFCMMILLPLTACTLNMSGAPRFVDRSTGWIPSVVYTENLDLRQFELNNESYYSVFFKGSELSGEVPLPNYNMSDDELMQFCLKLAFGSNYIDNGSDKIHVNRINERVCAYCTNETIVIINDENHSLIQCADTRLQSQFANTSHAQMHKGELVFFVDIAKLTTEEIKQYGQYTKWSLIGRPIHYQDGDLPLSANAAFDVSVSSVYEEYKNSPGAMGTIGGQFKVYDLKEANSWLIIGNQFMQVLEKDTGEQLLLMRPGTDLSYDE